MESGRARCGVALIVQESNTFSVATSTLADFEAQGLWLGTDAAERSRGSNTEIAGALAAIEGAGARAVPVLRAWAMSSGPLERDALARLRGILADALRAAGPLDGLVLD